MSSEARSAFITGSTRGIGRAVAERLLREGWTVAINGRDPEQVSTVATSLGARALPVAFDVTDSAACLSGVAGFARGVGGLDAVVHSAGALVPSPAGMISDAVVSSQLTLNVASAVSVSQAAIRVMGRAKQGSIVLFGSIAGEDGAAGQAVYAASKAAVGGLVRSLAKEVGPRGIRINGVVPGIIDTELNADLTPERRAELAAATPLRRLGEPTDVAEVVAFLVSDGARFITGSMIRVDGGLLLN